MNLVGRLRADEIDRIAQLERELAEANGRNKLLLESRQEWIDTTNAERERAESNWTALERVKGKWEMCEKVLAAERERTEKFQRKLAEARQWYKVAIHEGTGLRERAEKAEVAAELLRREADALVTQRKKVEQRLATLTQERDAAIAEIERWMGLRAIEKSAALAPE